MNRITYLSGYKNLHSHQTKISTFYKIIDLYVLKKFLGKCQHPVNLTNLSKPENTYFSNVRDLYSKTHLTNKTPFKDLSPYNLVYHLRTNEIFLCWFVKKGLTDVVQRKDGRHILFI